MTQQKAPEITVRLSETFRRTGKPYRYVRCQCGKALLIGRYSEVKAGSVAYCASNKCGLTVRITK